MNSLKLLCRRFLLERPVRAVELENIALRNRVEWLRGSLTEIRRRAQNGASPLSIASETQWALDTDAELSTRLPAGTLRQGDRYGTGSSRVARR
jgi:hypothetical protein